MEIGERIEKFKEFIEKNYKEKLARQLDKDQNFLVMDFQKLASFNPDIAERLLEEPEETIKEIQIAIDGFDILGAVKYIEPKFIDLPLSSEHPISKIGVKQTGKFVSIDGQVKSITQIYGHILSVTYECPSCGNVIKVLQLEQKMREPKKCGGCGRKGGFRILDKEVTNAFSMVIDEMPEKAETSTPMSIPVLAIGAGIAEPNVHLKLYAGTRVKVNGILKETPVIARDGGKLNKINWVLEANYIKVLDDDFQELEITNDDIIEIKKFSSRENVLELIAENVFEGISGLHEEKQMLILQAINGTKIEIWDIRTKRKRRKRGDLNILLIGDPSVGKTEMVKAIRTVLPKSRYTSGGSGVSEAGLIGGVGRDEFSGQPIIELGEIPLAHKGHITIDEIDGLTKELSKALNTAMEEQETYISKIKKARLKCSCPFLLCANPRNKRFDPHQTLLDQVKIELDTLSRIDSILIIRDEVDEEKDKGVLLSMFGLNKEEIEKVDLRFITKYLFYARSIEPIITEEAYMYIINQFLKVRTNTKNVPTTLFGNAEEQMMKNIPITYRDAMSAVRIAVKLAKVKLKNKVEREEAEEAWRRKMYSLSQISFDPDTGTFDSTRLYSGKTASEVQVGEAIIRYCRMNETIGKESGVKVEDCFSELEKKNGIPEELCEKALKKLKNSGDIFEPTKGWIRLI